MRHASARRPEGAQPAVILTPHPIPQAAFAALRLGASDFPVKGAKGEEILGAAALGTVEGEKWHG